MAAICHDDESAAWLTDIDLQHGNEQGKSNGGN
jgi:hypothetical protein